MKNLEKLKMEPLLLFKKHNEKIINGQKKVQILKLLGVSELALDMYNYHDGNYEKDILKMKDIED